nr:reverse transcriptase, RNA-dependent DNA polymerase, Gag-polypeptide of LTR copia-type [Tanacetum cinerariifolium]
MVIALNAKYKMKIINGDFVEPNSTSPIRALWERNNDMIISWILNTVVDQIVVKAYNMLRQEEKQREGLLPKPTMSAAFSVNSNNQRSNNNYQRNYNRSNYSQGESSTQDHILLVGNCQTLFAEIKSKLNKEFNIKDLGHLNYYLGIEFLMNSSGLTMSQRKYALDLLQQVNVLNDKPSITPLNLAKSLNDTDGDPLSEQ